MTARSLLPILLSDRQGQVDPARDHTLTALERHAWGRTDGQLRFAGYPMRSIITRDFHYIRNFKPDRWPVGDPPAQVPGFESLAGNTIAPPVDCDNGPSKAWLVTHREDRAIRPLYELAFGKRPACELYDLRHDPHELKNLAADLAFAAKVRELDDRLMAELKTTRDPRVTGNEAIFDQFDSSPWLPPPYRATSSPTPPGPQPSKK